MIFRNQRSPLYPFRYIGGSYVLRLKKLYENNLEDLLIKNQVLAEKRELMISALDGVCVRKDYTSDEPGTLTDIDIREYGHLIRVNDTTAKFFYELHCVIKPYFMVPVETDSVQKVLASLKINESLFQSLQLALPTLDSPNQRGLNFQLMTCNFHTNANLYNI